MTATFRRNLKPAQTCDGLRFVARHSCGSVMQSLAYRLAVDVGGQTRPP
ncbi:hypothetical protein AB0M00_16385 [Streptomyces chartreusis]